MKINQFCWMHLLCRAVSHGILPSSSLSRPKSALLKSRSVTMSSVLLPLLTILNSTISCALLRRMSLTFVSRTFTSYTNSTLFVSEKSSSASYISNLITCVSKLSSAHSRNLRDCLGSTVLPLRQISRWLKSCTRTRSVKGRLLPVV